MAKSDEQPRHLGSPNSMTQAYFDALRRLASSAASPTDPVLQKQNAALSIMLAITVVEAFFNLFFRVKVSESGFTQHAPRVLKDLDDRRSLDYKVKNWPRIVLGQSLDENSDAFKSFIKLKDRRNALMHFTSSHESLSLEGLQLEGVADVTVYESLVGNDALDAVAIAENFVAELLKASGFKAEQIPFGLRLWLGIA
jgi:hypothetical protein